METKRKIEVGKTYKLAGYTFTACKENENGTILLQSHGVCAGKWPGYVANDNNYSRGNYYHRDISPLYSEVKELALEIKGLYYKEGLFLASKDEVKENDFLRNALADAAKNHSSFGASYGSAWLGPVDGSNYAWCVNRNGGVGYNYGQADSYVVAPAFNLIPSKIIVTDDDVIVRKDDVKDSKAGTEYPWSEEDPVVRKLGVAVQTYSVTEMLMALYNNIDLFNVNTGRFLWHYNEEGSIGYADFDHLEEAKNVARISYANDDSWAAEIGNQGHIADDEAVFDLLRDIEKDGWVGCDDFEKAVIEVDEEKNHLSCKKGITLVAVTNQLFKVRELLGIQEKISDEEVYRKLYSDEVTLENFEKVYRFLDRKGCISSTPYYDTIEDAKADNEDIEGFIHVIIGTKSKPIILVKNDGELTDALWNELSSAVLNFEQKFNYETMTQDIASELRDRVVEWFEKGTGLEIIPVYENY